MLSLESLWLEAKPGGGQVQGKSQAWFSKRNNSKKQYLLGVGSSHPATYLGISLLCVASKAPGIVSKILWSTLWSCCLCMCGELPPQINLSRSILRMCTKHPIFLHYVSLYNYNYIYILYHPSWCMLFCPSMQRTKISTNSWPALLNWLFRRCKGEASSFTSGPFLSCDVHLVEVS